MIRIDSSRLFDAVKAVVPVAEKRNCLPILSHVLVSGNGRLELIATDLELGIKTWIDVQAESDFNVCLLGRTLKDMIANSAGEIEISVGEFNRATLSSASGVRELSGMDASDYPAWMDRQSSSDCTVSTKEFTAAMKKALQSCDTDRNARFNLNGVLLDGPSGVVVATDGHRLQKIAVDWIPESVKAIIPARALKQALSSIGKFKGVHELTLWFEEKNLWITSEVFEISIRLIDGDYPQYEKVIPERREDDAIIVNTKEFVKAVRQVKVMADTNDTMELWPRLEGALILRCISKSGSAQTEIACTFDAAVVPSRIELDGQYVLDAVRKCETDTIKLWLNPDGQACFVGDELVMPKKETVCPLPRPERVTGAPVFVPRPDIPFTPQPVIQGKPQDKKWIESRRASIQNRTGQDTKPRKAVKIVQTSQQMNKVRAGRAPKKATKKELNAWRYIQDEKPGETFIWICSYTRHNGVKVRGYWRERPVRVIELNKAA